MWWIAPAAHATDTDLFELAPALLCGVGSPQGEAPTTGPGSSVGLVGVYSRDPVVGRTSAGEQPAVRVLAPVILAVGARASERLRLDAMLPLYARVDAPWVGFEGAALGDLQLQAVIPLDNGEGPLHIALVPRLGLPTGSSQALVARGWHGGLRVALGGSPEARVGWLFDAGAVGARSETLQEGSPPLGSVAEAVGSVWLRSGVARVGLEADTELGLARPQGEGNDVAAGHLFTQLQSRSGLGVTAGAGAGLLAGLGSPRWRAFVGLSWTELRHDTDGDGFSDRQDACVEQPEDLDQFEDEDGCPDPDDDGDGVADELDSCAREFEDHDSFQDEDGCPELDNDADQIPDLDDRCPDLAGPRPSGGCPDRDGDLLADLDDQCPEHPGPPHQIGCPDTDGDGFLDPQDGCPDVPGPDAGCVALAVVTPEQIEIRERIEFELGSATLLPESAPVLDAVLAILLREPGITRLEVQGHTDNVGSDSANERLSQSRAEAVVRYLTDRGVDPSRLVAKGYGELVPLYTNKTASGRDKNRRVQFVIVSRG